MVPHTLFIDHQHEKRNQNNWLLSVMINKKAITATIRGLNNRVKMQMGLRQTKR